MLKSLKWLGRSREIVQGFVKKVRAEIGYQLYRVQQGLIPTDYKPMASVGKGVLEIRLHRPGEHRVIYVAKLKDRVYILHAFEKKTQKTSQRDIEIAKKNYQELIRRIGNLKIKE
ncbi:MAG: hypothetical protein A3G32_05750 [Deltaproteobacteria bacterium RIFCSPLOWO2_12_FULL_40_28]|nr:MAG: hypothetical protein A3C45_03920 [Deltaproteobacteria bacterium RIFCSPHIGHO2_02_FULL_40_28]OGQ18970.1 MAG: hypothetical protein A3E27_09750 [Deltaproteobacteria bacterium RIFCSPHIGHO2_12_FULL_40_32]OGQ39513.1 MAG: hypothetical protein A3I69_09865 [Deltaproteobacteria bacterium RIFCSPLOWO2_02_FULL_40_36]OGQ53403.1 MAG: hypothetical protein A3G32_05750 [Deltaproteobacteria bacterium RIFCSPLOWO2_12_FULL_40_28]